MTDIDDTTFHGHIIRVMNIIGVAGAAKLFKTSRPTVERWASGRNLPHPFVRNSVIQLAEKIKAP